MRLMRQKCPVQAIDRQDPAKTDAALCISCMRCVSLCPHSARRLNPRGAGGRQRHAEQGMLREEGMRAVSVRHGVREGCSSSGPSRRKRFPPPSPRAQRGMDGVLKEALDKFGQALTEFLQSTLDHAQEKQNAAPEQ